MLLKRIGESREAVISLPDIFDMREKAIALALCVTRWEFFGNVFKTHQWTTSFFFFSFEDASMHSARSFMAYRVRYRQLVSLCLSSTKMSNSPMAYLIFCSLRASWHLDFCEKIHLRFFLLSYPFWICSAHKIWDVEHFFRAYILSSYGVPDRRGKYWILDIGSPIAFKGFMPTTRKLQLKQQSFARSLAFLASMVLTTMVYIPYFCWSCMLC